MISVDKGEDTKFIMKQKHSEESKYVPQVYIWSIQRKSQYHSSNMQSEFDWSHHTQPRIQRQNDIVVCAKHLISGSML